MLELGAQFTRQARRTLEDRTGQGPEDRGGLLKMDSHETLAACNPEQGTERQGNLVHGPVLTGWGTARTGTAAVGLSVCRQARKANVQVEAGGRAGRQACSTEQAS